MTVHTNKGIDANGDLIPLTPAEIAEAEAREAAWAAGQAERDRIAHNAPIITALEVIDKKKARPIGSVARSLALQIPVEQDDLDKLNELELEAVALRAQLI